MSNAKGHGYKIAQLRIARGLNQTDFGKAIGVAQPTVAGWEGGKKRPTSAKLTKIADFLNVSIDYLLGNDKAKDSPNDLKEVLKEGLTYGGQELDSSDLAIIEDVIKGMLKRKRHDL